MHSITFKRNLQSIKRQHVTMSKLPGSKEGTFRHLKMAYDSKNSILLPLLTIRLDMEQCVLVPADVYNNQCLNTQTVTKQIPNYPAEQKPTYKNGSLKKEINKKQFAKADSPIDNILSGPRIKLSNWQTLELDSVETGVLMSDFAQQLRRKKTDIRDFYFTLPDAAGISPILVPKQNVKTKERESWVSFEISTTEAAKLVHEGQCCLWVCAELTGNH